MDDENITAETLSAPRRRFSPRKMLLLMAIAVVFLVFSLFTVNWTLAKRQQAAAERISDLEGRVDYDYEYTAYREDGSPIIQIVLYPDGHWEKEPERSPRIPQRLRDFFGDDFFYNVISANICNPSSLDDVKALRHCKRLRLSKIPLDDAVCRQLADMHQLRHISIYDSTLDQAAIDRLRRLRSDCDIVQYRLRPLRFSDEP